MPLRFLSCINYSDVINYERHELEVERQQFLIKHNSDRLQLKAAEDRILQLLQDCDQNILDHDDLISSLNDAKVSFKIKLPISNK